LLLSVTVTTQTDDPVRVHLKNYLMGHATGDPAYMRKAFLPTAHIEGMRDGMEDCEQGLLRIAAHQGSRSTFRMECVSREQARNLRAPRATRHALMTT
jgi:Putative lumazine-binding